MNHALPESQNVLVIPWLRVQNANTISSPLTHGFPAMSAFLGLMWALERKLGGRFPLMFESVGVVCHHHEAQTTQGYVRTFRLTRNPIDKDGSMAAIVEEGRIHLDLTLVFGVSGGITEATEAERAQCAQAVAEELATLRVAGGSLIPAPNRRMRRPYFQPISQDPEMAAKAFRRLRRSWLPGFVLVCRDDLLPQRLAALRAEQPEASALDAWLDLARFNWAPHREPATPPQDEAAAASDTTQDKIVWRQNRTGKGWLVPIPVGYGALGPRLDPGQVARARDSATPFRFVESLYSIGEWIAPHRLTQLEDMLWYPHADEQTGAYRACNDYFPPDSNASL